jgi:hypothetical protein
LAELLADQIDRVVEVSDPSSAIFFRVLLSWGGVFSGAAVWLIFTSYQLIDLRTELARRSEERVVEG